MAAKQKSDYFGEKKPLGIYIHIPFCNSKCNYCAFCSKVGTPEEKTTYCRDLLAEIKLRAAEYSADFVVASIYIGGGTPSTFENYEIRDILHCIYKYFRVKNDAEITIEVNPNSVTRTKLREYVLAGVNRFSVGLQTTNNNLLAAMGRTHKVEDFNNIINDMRTQGINNISADLIIGYPGQTIKDVEDSVKHLISLKIPHISCYMLQVEDKTKLKDLVDHRLVSVPEEGIVVSMYNKVVELLRAAGYNRYEISNFALPAFKSVHNSSYWSGRDYLGFGVAAHSLVNNIRFNNSNSLAKYHQSITELNCSPVENAKQRTIDEQKEEMIMLALRTNNGLDTKAYEAKFGENLLVKKKAALTNLITNGFLTLDKLGTLKVTDKGALVLNRIIYELI